MKVYAIKASAPGPFKEYKKMLGAPPQNIFSLAAATPGYVDIELCDETIDMKVNFKTDSDIVVMFFHTPDAVHTYNMAKKFKEKGLFVVLGGIHPSLNIEEAKGYCDTVLIGECEGIWDEFLEDFKLGRSKKTYKREVLVDLKDVNPYPQNLIKPSKYKSFWSVLVSRGCVHKCNYCAVPSFFCEKYRVRPIENIVNEIKQLPKGCWVELHADNLTADRDYALKLFKALKPLNRKWMGESTIKMADDDELLEAASESGCQNLLIGIETPSQSALSDSGKEFVSPSEIKEKIDRFHKYGIKISSSMIFGFDSHTTEIFKESLDFCNHIQLDHVDTVTLIPFPGTPLYEKMNAEERILTNDWSHYDGYQVVFTPKCMTKKELENGMNWFWKQISKKGSPSTEPISDNLTEKNNLKIKSNIALTMILIGIVFDWYWIWAILFLIWAINDLKNKTTYLLEEVTRRDNPFLYWMIISMWIFLSFWSISSLPITKNIFESAKIISGVETISPKLQTFKTGQLTYQTLLDSEYNFSIEVPNTWTKENEKSDSYVSYMLKNKDESGTINITSINLYGQSSMDDFIQAMEKEMSKYISSIYRKKLVLNKTPVVVKSGKSKTVQYSGIYHNAEVSIYSLYVIKGGFGYAVTAYYQDEDTHVEKQIYDIIKTFKISNIKND